MSSSALKAIAILLALGALALGYMGYQTSQAPVATSPEPAVETSKPEPVRLPVLVAARDINFGRTLSEDDVTTIFVEKLPEDTFSEQQKVIGQQVRLTIAAGDLILKDHFHDFSNLVSSIRNGERAIAVRVDEVTGVGGFVQPGDFVDVFLFLKAGPETADNSSAQRILSAARVLAYGNSLDETDAKFIAEKATLNADSPEKKEAASDTEPSGKQSKTAVLAVKDRDVSRLLLAESTGRLRLALLGAELLAEHTAHNQPVSKAELAEAEKQQRNIVTLDVFKVETDRMSSQTQPVAIPRAVTTPPPTPQPKVTVHRGVDEAAVSVNREH
ncbi:MAG: Flp pilus assembly protein CpaB [Methylophaga sp.]